MPSITVKIVYDRPVDDPYWLNEDNVSIALQAYCKKARFEVTTVVPWALCEGEESVPDETGDVEGKYVDPMDGTRRTDAAGRRL